MADVTNILEQYLKLRQAGRSPQAVLGHLRAAIEPLTDAERNTLGRGVRLIERGMSQPEAPWAGPATSGVDIRDISTQEPPGAPPAGAPPSVFDEVLAELGTSAATDAPHPAAPVQDWVLPTSNDAPEATPDDRWSLPRPPRAAPLTTALLDNGPVRATPPAPPAPKPATTDTLPTWSFADEVPAAHEDALAAPPTDGPATRVFPAADDAATASWALPNATPPRDEPATEPPRAVAWVQCPVCQEANVVTALTCSACGALLVTGARADTRVFSNPAHDADVAFPPGATLVLRPRNAPDGVAVEVTPSADMPELMVGRHSPRGAAVTPDVDLAVLGAEQLGVSRLHMALHFDAAHERLSATDLASANGTFVNGQRLAPREARVLRHGDELRLGRLVLVVLFRAGPAATARV